MIAWFADLRYATRPQMFGLVTLTLLLVAVPFTAIADPGLPGHAALGARHSVERLFGMRTAIAPNVTIGRQLALADGRLVEKPFDGGPAPAPPPAPAPVSVAVSVPPAVVPAAPAPGPQSQPTAPKSEPPPEQPKSEPPRQEPPPEEPKQEPPREEPPKQEPPKQEPPPASEPPAVPALFEADFEDGLDGWNTAGVGEVIPTVTTGIVRDGEHASTVVLTGTTDRSELILGGNGTGSTRGTLEFYEGDEYWYGFSFYISAMVYGHPGAHNLIMQFKSDGTGGPEFGLQLWDVNGRKGLWTAGTAMELNHSGERFLAAVPEDVWHDVQIHFKASEVGAGFYEVFLDGNLVDAKENVTMIVPGRRFAYIKTGLYRNGDEIPGTSELKIDAAKVGTTRESVLP